MLGDAVAAAVFSPLSDECFDVGDDALHHHVKLPFAASLIVVGKKAVVHIVVVA